MKTIMITFLISIQTVSALAFDLSDLDKKSSKPDMALVKEVLDNVPSWDIKTQDRVKKYAPMIIIVALSIDMDPKILLSVAWTESRFNPKAKSHAGALGLMQVKNDTKEYIFKKSPIHRKIFTSLLGSFKDTKSLENVIAGSLYIQYLAKKFKGNTKRAIIAYNEGPTGTYRLINKKYNLNNHDYFVKVSTNMESLKLPDLNQSMVAAN